METRDTEREVGFIALGTRTQLAVTPQATSSELLRVDSRELPDWAGRPETPTLLAFRYLRPGYHLSLVTRRFDPATVLQALVEEASLTTVVAEDGQMMTALAFAVRNNGRQFLELAVPPGAEVWSAFVAGQAVRPSQREGKVLIPLERSLDDAPITVEVTYVGPTAFPRGGR